VILIPNCGCKRIYSKLTTIKSKLRSTTIQILNIVLFVFVKQELTFNVKTNYIMDEFKHLVSTNRFIIYIIHAIVLVINIYYNLLKKN